MSNNILPRMGELNAVLTASTKGLASWENICEKLYHMLGANVYILDKDSRVIVSKFDKNEEKPLLLNPKTGRYEMPRELHEQLLAILSTQANLIHESIKDLYGADYDMDEKYHMIVPIRFGKKRIGTILFARSKKSFTDEDIALCEYGGMVVGIGLLRDMDKQAEGDRRKKESVSLTVKTLSYSEREAARHIFEALDGDEGLLVASKIADGAGITRSVIVNALRKMESAGVIQTKSLGMRGTMIRITNPFLREGLETDLFAL